MKIAVISDVHGNLSALETVTADLEAWTPDMVFVGGDIVNRGPLSAECVRFIQAKQREDGWLSIRGNHEDYVILQSHVDSPRSGPEFEIFRPANWVYERLDRDVSWLDSLPHYIFWGEGGETRVCLAHGWIGTNRWGIFDFMEDDMVRRAIGQDPPALLLTAHTHTPMSRMIGRTCVFNVGSVGLPFDGDWHAAYARLEFNHGVWDAGLVRLPYDRARTVRDFERTGYQDAGGPVTHLMLTELLNARPQMFSFTRGYQDAVLSGALSVEQAVQKHLEDQGYSYPVLPADYLNRGWV